MPARGQEAAPAEDPIAVARRRRRRFALLLSGLAIALGVVIVLAVGLGPVLVPPRISALVILHELAPALVEPDWRPVQQQIIIEFRLPRTLLAALVGAGLSIVGGTLQAVVRNPLADPFVLGISSGAGVGAVLVIVAGSAAIAGLSLSAAAFAGATLATAILFLLARHRGQLTPLRLVLSGVTLSYLFSAVTSFLTLTTDADKVFSVLFFLLGSVSAATWGDLQIPALVLALVAVWLLSRARTLNALLAGDETATSLGVDVNRLRMEMLLLTSLLTGVLVAVSGGIGFVGLVVPHVARLLVGADHRRMLPVAAFGGAVFLVLADLLARTAASPTELPIGIVTATVGAPFFLWLMRRDTAARRAGMAR
ncbi:FecCD family ABC transporter permease [Micromonospora craniellae]|uniref:Iron ABC transporter permease n=1 Tax=Micromonospora craniellae TaxID=2294034 RepID=A0A372FYJ3_9ACTN|nr:iron ABC transporter permease [Micromonospora craniellae]QOC93434.1 iron ABC transporter permease [Micromonospora craniellae]RFS45881.1 iron ABC transporter permease [Micromonospora craniellae]